MSELQRAAARVLDANWTGSYTTPSTGLYPHQWSWDSAFIAIGLRHLWPQRARQELTTLFGAQWPDGRVPQIVYDPAHPDDYQPNAAFWAATTAVAPVPSAGLVQPPNHAWAVELVHRADPDGSMREGFLAALYPRLLAWHDYLRTQRTSPSSGLAAVVHPWESGTDNSPLWDEAMAPLPKVHHAVPRPDLEHARPAERPSQKEYGTYYWIAERYRDQGCTHHGPEPWPFLLEDPATNALWARSELSLTWIAEQLGANPRPHRDRARELTQALGSLFDDELGLFVARDVTAQRLVRRATINGLVPLVLPDLPQGPALLQSLTGPRFLGGGAVLVPSYDLTAPDVDPARYWRGPAWFNMAWLLIQGLGIRGEADLAATLSANARRLALQHDFPEYVDPISGEPHGSRLFSWTAALAIDLEVTEGR